MDAFAVASLQLGYSTLIVANPVQNNYSHIGNMHDTVHVNVYAEDKNKLLLFE